MIRLGRANDAFAEMRRFLALRPESYAYVRLRAEMDNENLYGDTFPGARSRQPVSTIPRRKPRPQVRAFTNTLWSDIPCSVMLIERRHDNRHSGR